MVNLFTEFEKSANRNPDSICVTYEDFNLTYAQVLAASQRLAGKLLEMAPGNSTEADNNIAIFAPNLPGYLIAFYGILAADKTTVPINFLLNQNEIMTIGMHAGMRTVIATGPLYEKALEMAQMLPINVLRAEDFIAPGDVPVLPPVARGDDDTAVLMYTSGTTGAPKGVELTHKNLVANYESVVGAWPFHSGNTFVGVIPLFHSFAMLALLLLGNFIGGRLVLIPQFQPQKLIEAFTKYPECVFFGVPPFFKVLAHAAASKGIKMPNLKLCVTGAAALPNDVKEAWEGATGIELFQGYGLSEASPAVSFNLPGAHKAGSIGRPIKNVEVEIWDESGNKLPNGEVGELMVHGENVMKGYYKNPEETAKSITSEGWLHTGDLAQIDEEGYISIAGRKKELIISAGENIYPLEIEHVLMSYPGVADAAVIAIPHPTRGEDPKAYVQPLPGVTLEAPALKAYCREKLAAFKIPVEFEFREELPRNPTGKVLKRLLEAELKK